MGASEEITRSRAVEEDLATRFTYHPPKPGQVEIYQHIRDISYEMAKDIVAMTPGCREQALALTALEQAVMWANAAVARRT